MQTCTWKINVINSPFNGYLIILTFKRIFFSVYSDCQVVFKVFAK